MSRMYRALSLTSLVAVITIALSVVTNKIISISSGTEGIAVLGMFRTLGALITGVLGLGYATIFNQHAATIKNSEASRRMLQTAFFLFLLQGSVILLLAFGCSTFLNRWIFQSNTGQVSVMAIRLVFLMAFINIAYQNSMAILRGAALLKKLSVVQIVVSISSLIMIYPLLQLGPIGLAINIGSGSLIGTVLAVAFIQRHYHSDWLRGFSVSESWQEVRKYSVPSLLLVWQMAYVMICLLGVQTLMGKYFGLEFLGNFNAAYLIVDTALLILMSSVRSYFLPELARLEKTEEKQKLLLKMLRTHLVLAFAGSLILVVGAKPVVHLLFSRQFDQTVSMLQVMTLGIIGFVFIWTYNTFLLHLGKHAEFVILDTIWTTFFLGCIFVLGHWGNGIVSVTWAYTAAAIVGAALYVGFVSFKYGRGYFSWIDTLFAAMGIGILFVLGKLI